MVMDAFGGWDFPLTRVSQVISCVTIFVGMLLILLHVDFNCIFISDLVWVMWKWLHSLLQVSLYKIEHTYVCSKTYLSIFYWNNV